MPLYEYQCRNCGRRFEVIQKVNEGGALLECPSCGQKGPEKLMSCCFSLTKSTASTSSSSSCGAGSSRFT